MGQAAFLSFCLIFFLIPATLASIKPTKLVEQKNFISLEKTKLEKSVEGASIVAVTITPLPTQQNVQINKNTWRINAVQDSTMGTAPEIFAALNTYRQKKGIEQISWNDNLGAYAQSRADLFFVNGRMDGHSGFNDYISNQNGFAVLGFSALGENSTYLGGPFTATRIIEVIFAGDAPHDNNQLDPKWTHVGIGVHGFSVDVVFGGAKK